MDKYIDEIESEQNNEVSEACSEYEREIRDDGSVLYFYFRDEIFNQRYLTGVFENHVYRGLADVHNNAW